MDIILDFNNIKDWESYHSVFADIMGFPAFYGKNDNAWIDCMSYIDDIEAGMSEITVKPNESLNIIVKDTEKAIENKTEIFLGFMECVAFVNQRFIDSGSETRLNVIAT